MRAGRRRQPKVATEMILILIPENQSILNPRHDILLFHPVWKIGLPVRSAVLKPHAGELVVGWVTTSESSLLYVLCFCFCISLVALWDK
ncbi:hypothetical protein N7519_000511 [Penicillium mononematosum]|nr:hypothetical protein N7519_000511 [Penicillium mononematosum]